MNKVNFIFNQLINYKGCVYIYIFLDLRKLHPQKAHFMGSGERVKLLLSQALTKSARPNSNLRHLLCISKVLCHHTTRDYIY